jgi:hypothetical protein
VSNICAAEFDRNLNSVTATQKLTRTSVSVPYEAPEITRVPFFTAHGSFPGSGHGQPGSTPKSPEPPQGLQSPGQAHAKMRATFSTDRRLEAGDLPLGLRIDLMPLIRIDLSAHVSIKKLELDIKGLNAQALLKFKI